MDGASPSLSDRLAITALVISLVALLIGVSSLLQAILGTAEGYRRCARSVIGPWSSLRGRDFKLSEFRLETKFVTPLIVIVSPYDLRQAEDINDGDELYLLNPEPATQRNEPLRLTSVFPWRHYNPAEVLNESLHWSGQQQETHFPSGYHSADAVRRRRSSREDNEVDETLGTLESNGKAGDQQQQAEVKSAQRKSSRNGPRNGLPVTWVRLLRELHLLYIEYWPKESRSCQKTCPINDVDGEELDFSHTSWKRAANAETIQRNVAARQNDARTRIAIIPVQETWDFMPPDVSRPLASSRIGFILVIAIRLGMQWRTLDRSRSQMNADGNGFSITSTDIRGLGMVLKFSAFTHHGKPPMLVPSRAVDKMMCGIIPGDPQLVQQDFNLVNNERKIVSVYDNDGVLQSLGLPQVDIDEIRTQDRFATQMKSSLYFAHLCHCHYDVFHFFESRLALRNYLGKEGFQHTATTTRVSQHLDALLSDFGYEFCNGYYKHPPKDEDPIQRSIRLSELCAAIFEEITAYFLNLGYHAKNGTSRTWYAQLVAAHARLSMFVMRDHTLQQRDQATILAYYASTIETAGISTKYFAEHLYLLATSYASAAPHADYGIAKYMYGRSFPKHERTRQGAGAGEHTSTILDDWWMLMLRGIVWDMSSNCLNFVGEPVPSSYYDDETSVWFT